ncbi:hypothetical protein Pyn_32510 [Prunus yedoensis var. nudiflora]|uniref:WHIM2 domain-containing protein n=1 Tax=Prunus yedoensis var. nudiflora TaxID=2094558 RepID=A0A314UN16_PRUYE|nr:hypothetical protein Pyn_32510 [Prunus yedoensis var. nudiflora]
MTAGEISNIRCQGLGQLWTYFATWSGWLKKVTRASISKQVPKEYSRGARLSATLSVAASCALQPDPINAIAECIPSSLHSGSGAKIKRLSTKQHGMPKPTWVHAGHTTGAKEDYTLKFHPIDSSGSISKFPDERFSTKEKNGKEREVRFDLHPMQSVFLGSDRRYNRYWLFLGPCNAYDPGHRRVYFESSEDGHWEVIDTEEALCALLSVLDDRGKREALLIESLEKRIAFLCQAMSSRMVNSDRIDNLAQSDQSELDSVREDTYSPVSDVDNNLSGIANDSLPSSGVVVLEVRKKGEQQKQKWSRIQAFDSWLWNSFYLDLNAVKHGKRSYFDTLTDVKVVMICIGEMRSTAGFAIRHLSFILIWKKLSHAKNLLISHIWVKRLRRTSSLAELLQGKVKQIVGSTLLDSKENGSALVDLSRAAAIKALHAYPGGSMFQSNATGSGANTI